MKTFILIKITIFMFLSLNPSFSRAFEADFSYLRYESLLKELATDANCRGPLIKGHQQELARELTQYLFSQIDKENFIRRAFSEIDIEYEYGGEVDVAPFLLDPDRKLFLVRIKLAGDRITPKAVLVKLLNNQSYSIMDPFPGFLDSILVYGRAFSKGCLLKSQNLFILMNTVYYNDSSAFYEYVIMSTESGVTTKIPVPVHDSSLPVRNFFISTTASEHKLTIVQYSGVEWEEIFRHEYCMSRFVIDVPTRIDGYLDLWDFDLTAQKLATPIDGVKTPLYSISLNNKEELKSALIENSSYDCHKEDAILRDYYNSFPGISWVYKYFY